MHATHATQALAFEWKPGLTDKQIATGVGLFTGGRGLALLILFPLRDMRQKRPTPGKIKTSNGTGIDRYEMIQTPFCHSTSVAVFDSLISLQTKLQVQQVPKCELLAALKPGFHYQS